MHSNKILYKHTDCIDCLFAGGMKRFTSTPASQALLAAMNLDLNVSPAPLLPSLPVHQLHSPQASLVSPQVI